MDLTLGARLRLQREQRQVALTAIADQTKIRVALLEGLERDDISDWPAGIFRRAYVRAYAHALGIEPEPVVREFLTLYPDEGEEFPAIVSARQGGSASSRPPTRLESLVGNAISSLPGRRAQPAAGPTTGPVNSEPVYEARGTTVDRAVPAREPNHASIGAAIPGETHAAAPLVQEAPRRSSNLMAIADLCTSLACAQDANDVAPALKKAAGILDAVGLIVWTWDPAWRALVPVLACGYADEVLAQLPRVRRDADNAIAATFRSLEAGIVDGTNAATGAVVVPLIVSAGCVGVLSAEFRGGVEQSDAVRAVATILAAQLATLVALPSLVQATA